jgi:hypothetical protein
MPEQSQELLATIGQSMVRAAPPGWQELVLHATGAGRMTETTLDVRLANGSVDTSHEVDDAGQNACHDLRKAMYQEGKGTWYNARFTIESSRQLYVDFDYDGQPFDGDAADELLEGDQQRFPRDRENLPEWHPSQRRSSSSDD